MSKDDIDIAKKLNSEQELKAKLFRQFIDKKAKKEKPEPKQIDEETILTKVQPQIEAKYKKDKHIVNADLEKQDELLAKRLATRKHQTQHDDIFRQDKAIENKQEARKETYIDKVADRATNYIKQEVEKYKSIGSKEIEKICKSDGLKKIVETILKKPEEQKLFQESVQKELKDITIKTATKENKLSYWESFKKTISNVFENVISVFKDKEKTVDVKDKMSSKMREILSKGAKSVQTKDKMFLPKSQESFVAKIQNERNDKNKGQRSI